MTERDKPYEAELPPLVVTSCSIERLFGSIGIGFADKTGVRITYDEAEEPDPQDQDSQRWPAQVVIDVSSSDPRTGFARTVGSLTMRDTGVITTDGQTEPPKTFLPRLVTAMRGIDPEDVFADPNTEFKGPERSVRIKGHITKQADLISTMLTTWQKRQCSSPTAQ